MSQLDRFANDYSHEPVPKDQRRTWLSLAALWTAALICVPAFLMGVEMGQALNLKDILIVSLAGAAFFTIITFLIAPVCHATHLPTGQILRMAFGSSMGKVITFIICLNSFGWFGIQLEFFAGGVGLAIQETLNITLPSWVIIVSGGTLMITTAMIGYKAIEKLSYITIPFMMLIIIWPFVSGHAGQGINEAILGTPVSPQPLGVMLGMYVGGFAGGMAISPDLFRYIKNAKHSIAGMAAAFFIAAPLVFVVMAYFSIITGQHDIAQILFILGLGLPALMLIVLSTWTTNDTNLYAASLGLTAILPQIKKWKIAIIAGTLGTALALMGILSNFMQYLIYLGVIMMPIVAVMVVDYRFNPQNYNQTADAFMSTQTRNIIAVILGTLVGLGTAFSWWELTTVAPIDGFLTSCVFLILANIFQKRKAINA